MLRITPVGLFCALFWSVLPQTEALAQDCCEDPYPTATCDTPEETVGYYPICKDSEQICRACQGGVAEGPDLMTIVSGSAIVSSWCLGPNHAFSITGGIANIGTECLLGEPVNPSELADNSDHAAFAQNLYRLTSGNTRFEQIGMSWLKHDDWTFNAGPQGSFECSKMLGTCYAEPDNEAGLFPGNLDVYAGGGGYLQNGNQAILGPRAEINAASGVFTPLSDAGGDLEVLERRLQVSGADLTLSGARLFFEAHSISRDDATARNKFNNASYIEVTVEPGTDDCGEQPGGGPYPDYELETTGTYLCQKPAIRAWQDADPGVVESEIEIPGDGKFILAAKATAAGGGLWNYEYALYNMNSDLSAKGFRVPKQSTSASDFAFHDVHYHSGDPWSGDDWYVDTEVPLPGAVQFDMPADAVYENSNALRWGTLYNFRFLAGRAPATGIATIWLFKSATGVAAGVPAVTIAPAIGTNIDPAPSMNRFLQVAIPAGVFFGNGAIRIKIERLDGFSEDFIGDTWWVGAPANYTDGSKTFKASELVCCPNCRNWANEGPVYVYGPAIVPNSVYRVQWISSLASVDFCNEANFKDLSILRTAKWGDVVEAFDHEFSSDQPAQADIDAVTAKVQELPEAIARVRAKLQPRLVDPATAVNVIDLGYAVNAESGSAYPFAAPDVCAACSSPWQNACTECPQP